jgi:hypothetical protein
MSRTRCSDLALTGARRWAGSTVAEVGVGRGVRGMSRILEKF